MNNNGEFKFNTIDEAVKDLRNGKMLIVVDDRDRENEGDLIMAAELVKPEDVNFITREGSGLLCLPVAAKIADKLQLKPMVENNTSLHKTPISVSIEYRHGPTT